jgi:hypothetical protein
VETCKCKEDCLWWSSSATPRLVPLRLPFQAMSLPARNYQLPNPSKERVGFLPLGYIRFDIFQGIPWQAAWHFRQEFATHVSVGLRCSACMLSRTSKSATYVRCHGRNSCSFKEVNISRRLVQGSALTPCGQYPPHPEFPPGPASPHWINGLP